MLKRTLLGLSLALVMVGGAFVYNAMAVGSVTPATGGTNISIDTTSASGGSGAWASLSGLTIVEGAAADIAVGVHTLTLPAGWEFDTSQEISLGTIGNGLTLSSNDIYPATASTINFTVNATSTNADKIIFENGIKVRPTGTTTSTGNIHLTAGVINGLDGSTSFGTLSTVAGVVTKVAFTTQPTDTTYGSTISSVVVKTQDQFGNNSVNGLASTETVDLSSSAPTLSGTTTGNIGTGSGNGVLTFSNLKIDTAADDYTLTANAGTLTDATSTEFDIDQKTLTATVTVDSKTYDKTNTANIASRTLIGVETDDDVTASGGTAIFSDVNVGANVAVTASGITISGGDAANYSFNGTATGNGAITKEDVDVHGSFTVSNKVYNGNATATMNVSSLVLDPDDIEAGDTVSLDNIVLAFENKNVGTDKIVSISSASLAGAEAGNYELTLDGAPTSTASITVRGINVTAQTDTKTYDGNTTSSVLPVVGALQGGDTVNSRGVQTFNNKMVGTNKTLTATSTVINDGNDGANYSITYIPDATGVISVKTLDVTAPTVVKTYDDTTSATGTATYVGLVSGDEINDVATLTFSNENIGAGNKTVTPSAVTIEDSVDADMTANYNIVYHANTASTINPKVLTVTGITAEDKVYDSSDVAELDADEFALVGIEGDDVVTATSSLATGVFNNANIGVEKPVIISGLALEGDDAGNYSLTQPTATASITQKPLSVTAPQVSKEYDGNTTATGTVTYGALAGDDVIDDWAALTFNNKNAGSSKTVTPSGVTIDNDAGEDVTANYNITYVANNLSTITQKALTVTAPEVSKVYDGGTTATGTSVVVGLVTGDVVSAPATLIFDDADMGIGDETVTPSAMVVRDGLGAEMTANYLITYVDNTTSTISPKTLTVSGITANNKVYDGATDATLTGTAALVGIVSPDTVSLAGVPAAVFNNANAANGKTVTVSGYTLSNNEDGNYSLTQPTLSANITKFAPVITWATPDDIVAGTALNGTQLNASATGISGSLAGGFAYNPVSGTAFTEVGTETLETTFTPTDGVNYSVATSSVEINIIPAAIAKLTITASPNNLVAHETSTITVTGKDQYNNVTTNNSSAIVSLSTDNGGSLNSSMLTLTNGLKTTTLTKESAGLVHVNAISGSVTPATTDVTFTAIPTDTTPPAAPVITTASSTVNADFYTISGTVTADANSVQTVRVLVGTDVYGTVIVPKNGTAWSVAVSLPQSAATTFKSTSADEAGNVSGDSNTVVITESAIAGQGNGTLTVSSITPVRSYATTGGGFTNGWSWTFNVTVPTNEASTTMKFADWISGSNTIAAANNIRFYSAQSSNANSTSTAIMITGANTYSSAMTINGDSDVTREGRQIQITVEAQVPEAQAGGSYSTSYGIQSN